MWRRSDAECLESATQLASGHLNLYILWTKKEKTCISHFHCLPTKTYCPKSTAPADVRPARGSWASFFIPPEWYDEREHFNSKLSVFLYTKSQSEHLSSTVSVRWSACCAVSRHRRRGLAPLAQQMNRMCPCACLHRTSLQIEITYIRRRRRSQTQ